MRFKKIVACGFLLVGLGAFGASAFAINDFPPLWSWIRSHTVGIERITFISILAAFSVVIFLAAFRAPRPRGQATARADGHGQAETPQESTQSTDSLWEALPFASMVFFLVAIFTLCDLAHSAEDEEPAKLLLKLGISLAGALVTAIVVLYGAHLVRFEGKVHDLTAETGEAKKGIDAALRQLDEFRQNAEKLTNLARATHERLSTLEIDVGMAMLASRVGVRYRATLPKVPENLDLRPYIRARSCHALASDEAVFKSADHTALAPSQVPSARNMISSFLEEMAWDLSQRALVTNAHNYTSFLVGAARGFEEEIEGAKNDKLRVFFLTHTLVTPQHLLNWPRSKSLFWSCQPTPFMLEYMTYCRYFACKKDHFIHARLISGEPDGVTSDLSENPFLFSRQAASNPTAYGLPGKCNAWGIPHWGQVAIETSDNAQFYHKDALRTQRPQFPKLPVFPDQVVPHIFGAYPHQTRGTPMKGVICKSSVTELHSVHWPIFFQEILDQDGSSQALSPMAGDPPDFATITNQLSTFLENLLGELIKERDDEASRELVKSAYNNVFLKAIRGNVTRTTGHVDAAHNILQALELFQSFRWAFQGEEALKAWEDLRTAVFVLVNLLLAQGQNTGMEGLVDFGPWFKRTFHSSPDLSICYPKDKLQAAVQNCRARREEFALIGLLELENKNTPVNANFIVENLRKWHNRTGGAVKEILGLRSSIEPPWKFAEMEWIWACKKGRPALGELVSFYADAIEAGL
jgi:hypothetical protein